MPTYTFGTAKLTGKPDWLIQNTSKIIEAQEALALDEVGEPVVAHYYQKITNMNFEAIIPANDSTIPDVGDIFTYGGVSYYVSGVSITEQNTDFVRYALTCKRFTTAGLPSNS